MTHDRLAYYKWLRLGDFLKGPEERAPIVTPTPFVSGGWDNSVTPIQQGAGLKYGIGLQCCLLRGHADPNETTRQFEKRKLQFIKDCRTGFGFAPGTYAQRGPLSIVEDSEDVTTIVNNETTGSAVVIEIANDPGFQAGDLALLVQGTQHEVIVCGVVNPGVSVRANTLTLSWTAGATIARLLYYFPNCYGQQAPIVPGNAPGTNSAAVDMECRFETVEDPVEALA